MFARSLLIIFIFTLTITTAHTAEAQQLEKRFKNWDVYTILQNGKKICYMASKAIKKRGNYKRRGEPYLLITHIKKGVDEVSASSGYSYKKGKEVNIKIGKKDYKLFTKGKLAWAYDTPQDKSMVKSMIKGNNLTVKGYSTLGTHSIDTYSLMGFTKAHQHMEKLCS